MNIYSWACARCGYEFGIGSYPPSEECPNCKQKTDYKPDPYEALLTKYEQKQEEKRDEELAVERKGSYVRWESK